MNKTILLLDTNFSSKPIYDSLTNLGFKVFVVGAKTDDYLAKTSQYYIKCDYSNVHDIVKIVNKYKVNFIFPGCNDVSYFVCAMINEILHNKFKQFIDTVQNFYYLNNKLLFKKISQNLKVPIPKLYNDISLIDKFPVIVKPVDSYSGKGNTLVYDSHLLKEAIRYAEGFSRTKRCIVEEYVEGQLYSHSAFLIDHKIVIDFVVKENCVANIFTVDTSYVVFDFPDNVLQSLRDDITLLSKKLSLVNGLIHTQFIYDKNNYWIIEITRRCPGDLYSELIEFTTGFNYSLFYALLFIKNYIPEIAQNYLKKDLIIRHTITSNIAFNFNYIKFNLPIFIQKYLPLATTGDLIRQSPYSRIGLIFIKCKDDNEQKILYDSLLKRKLYELV